MRVVNTYIYIYLYVARPSERQYFKQPWNISLIQESWGHRVRGCVFKLLSPDFETLALKACILQEKRAPR